MADKTVFKFGKGKGSTGLEDEVEKVALSGSDEEEEEHDEDEEEEEEETELPNSILNRVLALKDEDAAMGAINEEYKKERLAIERKYLEQKAALWAKRAEIISGAVEVESKVAVDPEDKTEGIPNFWAAAIGNHPTVGGLATEEDMAALAHLTDIRVEYNDDWSSFTLIFVFKENEFFTNKELRKSYVVSPDLLEDKAPELNRVEGSEINWLPSKNLTVTEIKKKQKATKGKHAGQTRVVTKTEPKASFFHYFSDPRIPDEDDENEDGNDDGKNEFTLSIDEDYEIGHAFRTEIIPDAILWYTGEAHDEVDLDGEDEDGEEDGDEDEDGDDDGDDPADGAGLTATPGGGFQAGAQAGQNPECKQS